MKRFISVFAAAPLLLSAGVAMAGPDSESEVRAYLESEGFEVLGDVDFEVDSGVWEAKVLAEGGDRIEVHVDPVTGRIVFGDEDPTMAGRPVVFSDPPPAVIVTDPAPEAVIVTDPTPDTVVVTQDRPDTVVVPVPTPMPPPPALNADDVRVILSDAGFHDVHDIEFEDDHWRAEARDATGEDYELKIDPIDGRIVHLEDD